MEAKDMEAKDMEAKDMEAKDMEAKDMEATNMKAKDMEKNTPPSFDAALEVHNLTVLYDKNAVLWDVDFRLPRGKLIGIVGPNGAGKSTLLKAIMELVPAYSGYAKVFDEKLHKVRHRVSYVPQRESVDWDFPASVEDVVMMGRYGRLGLFKRVGQEDQRVVRKCLETLGLASYAKRQIAQLSGGQQQRVFIARALAQEAELYLMDEPFVGIDVQTEKIIFDLLKSLSAQGKTMIIVFHNLHSVARHFDWLVLLNKRLIASGPTREVFVRELLTKTYGGELALFSEVREKVEASHFSQREESP